MQEGASYWDAAEEKVCLQHTAADHDAHVRAYFKESMPITKCHEDVQAGKSRGNVLRYVATYTPKFSDAFAKEWLNDDASDYSVSRRVLFDYHPLEPEMWLSLGGRLFPQCYYGGTLEPLLPPWPGMAEKPAYVELYETCPWRRESMPLLEWLRKVNKEGKINRWLHAKHRDHVCVTAHNVAKESGSEKNLRQVREELVKAFKQRPKAAAKMSFAAFAKDMVKDVAPNAVAAFPELEEFANTYSTHGEKLIAAETVSRLNDKYYGQWLALHEPFRSLDKLKIEEIEEKVPERYRHFATAWMRRREYWEDETAIREEMMLEADGDDFIETVLYKVKAQIHPSCATLSFWRVRH